MNAAMKFFAAGTLAVLAAFAMVLPSVGTEQIPSASAASSDYFLKLEGVDGEIAIESFSWGVSQREAGSGLSTGKRQHKPLTITKPIDKSSPLLYRMAVDGTRTKGAMVLTGQTSDGKPFTIAFFDVFIEAFAMTGEPGAAPTESISFNYQKIEWR